MARAPRPEPAAGLLRGGVVPGRDGELPDRGRRRGRAVRRARGGGRPAPGVARRGDGHGLRDARVRHARPRRQPADLLPLDRVLRRLAAGIVAALAVLAPGPHAAPPVNDAPAAAAGFESYAAENGRPRELQASAELFEATGDPGIEPCLGPFSFARTVWYRVPEAVTPQVISVEASGRT